MPAALAEIVHKAMQRDPELRYQSMEEIAAALQDYLGEQDAYLLPGELSAARDPAAGEADTVRQSARSSPAPAATTAAPAGQAAAAMQSTVVVASKRPPGPAPGRRAGRLVAFAIALVAILAGGAGLFVAVRQQRSTAAVPTAADDKPRLTVRVAIRPATAKVTVAGREQPLFSGYLKLTGEPGERFEVTVELDGIKDTQTVQIVRDGSPSIPTIALPTASAAASSSAATSARASPSAPTGSLPRPSGHRPMPPARELDD